MAQKKSSHLSVIRSYDTIIEAQRELVRLEKQEGWGQSREEIANCVRELRKELEAAKARYDGALFDNYTDGIPRSLDYMDINRAPFGAVYFISPKLKAMVEGLQKNKPIRCLSDDVFELFFWGTDTAYQIGMLAGAIYADCPTATIDRFERGLIVSLAACHWIGK
jgi:hypothetical protein